MSCATYIADPGFQLQSGGITGPYDCTPWSASNAIDHATCGAKDPSGRHIRLLSSEPVPDPNSPGLNLPQVAAVAYNDYGVYLDVRIGGRAVTWAEYERRRKAGQGCIIQVGYGPIADSRYDAGRGFRGNHALFESIHASYDPLADGRASGVFRHDGSVYQRDIMRWAAAKLVVASSSSGVVYAGTDKVWAAFTRDVVPDFSARVPAGDYWAYAVDDGAVQYRRTRTTGGFSAACSPPRSYRWGTRSVNLVRLLSGVNAGRYISANYVR